MTAQPPKGSPQTRKPGSTARPARSPKARRRSGRSGIDRNVVIVGIALVALAIGGIVAFTTRGSADEHPSFAQLAVGYCLDLPEVAITPAAPTPTPVPVEPGNTPTPPPAATPAPPVDQVSAAVLAGQATRVSCSGTHSHEVVGTTGIQVGERYLGRAFLLDIAVPACSSSFKDYVGHDVDGSKLAMTIVVPDQDAWDAKERRAVCLASFADGTAATGPMKGSGA
jgi:putative regulator of septum formation